MSSQSYVSANSSETSDSYAEFMMLKETIHSTYKALTELSAKCDLFFNGANNNGVVLKPKGVSKKAESKTQTTSAAAADDAETSTENKEPAKKARAPRSRTAKLATPASANPTELPKKKPVLTKVEDENDAKSIDENSNDNQNETDNEDDTTESKSESKTESKSEAKSEKKTSKESSASPKEAAKSKTDKDQSKKPIPMMYFKDRYVKNPNSDVIQKICENIKPTEIFEENKKKIEEKKEGESRDKFKASLLYSKLTDANKAYIKSLIDSEY